MYETRSRTRLRCRPGHALRSIDPIRVLLSYQSMRSGYQNRILAGIVLDEAVISYGLRITSNFPVGLYPHTTTGLRLYTHTRDCDTFPAGLQKVLLSDRPRSFTMTRTLRCFAVGPSI